MKYKQGDSNMNLLTKIKIAKLKISYQFDKTAEQQLMLAIIKQALNDLMGSMHDRNSSVLYLSRPIPHAEICGVSSDWIREVISKCGIDLNDMQAK